MFPKSGEIEREEVFRFQARMLEVDVLLDELCPSRVVARERESSPPHHLGNPGASPHLPLPLY